MYPMPPPGGLPPGEIPPHLRNRRDTPWWVVLLYVMGGLAALGVLGVVAVFGFIAFACGHH